MSEKDHGTERILISCEGLQLGQVSLPPFQVRTGQLVCLHLPTPAVLDTHPIMSWLTGERLTPNLRLAARVIWARPAAPKQGMLRRIVRGFRCCPAADWLSDQGGISHAEAVRIVEKLGLSPGWCLEQLAMNPRTLLGLEAAYTRGAEVVLFSTLGCDPSGRRKVFETVWERLNQTAAVYLSFPFTQNGLLRRDCFPSSICVEAKVAAASTATEN
jgi:hypothetical protein